MSADVETRAIGTHKLTVEEDIVYLIKMAGRVPVERDTVYNVLKVWN